MKKIFTLAFGIVLSIAMFAADRRPIVTVSANRKFEIVIDGRSYASNNMSPVVLSNLYGGRHSVAVYEQGRSFFFSRKKLVSSSSFQLRNADIAISVDRFGQVNISESRQQGWYDGNGGGRFDGRDVQKDSRDMHQNDKNYDNRDMHQNDKSYNSRDAQQNDRNTHDRRGH